MEAHIINALRNVSDGLTARLIVALLKTEYPDEKDLKKRVNALLYGVLTTSGKVTMSLAPAECKSKAPIWMLTDQALEVEPAVDVAVVHPASL